MGRIVLKLLLQLLALCLVIAAGCWLLEKFVWWLVRNDCNGLFIKAGAIFSDDSIEYVRKDAFIEKVESFLNRKDDRDSYTIGYIRRHLKEIIKEVGL